jgi:hypothetical protein
MTKLNLDQLSVESFEAVGAKDNNQRKAELFASNLNSCWDTACGRAYCVSSPCAMLMG